MGFKRPEVRIFSPRRLEANKIKASSIFYTLENMPKIA